MNRPYSGSGNSYKAMLALFIDSLYGIGMLWNVYVFNQIDQECVWNLELETSRKYLCIIYKCDIALLDII